MKRISVILIIGLVLVACGEQTEPLMPLDKGAPNTVTLSTGDVVYDISGEWDAIIGYGAYGGDQKDIVKINQDGNKFTGFVTIGHTGFKIGEELLTGELEKNGFKSIQRMSLSSGRISSSGKIDESCKTIIVKSGDRGHSFSMTLTRK